MVRPQIKLNREQGDALRKVILGKYSSLEDFSQHVEAMGKHHEHTNAMNYAGNTRDYLDGKIAITLRPAEVYLEVLGDREGLGFLREFVETARTGSQAA